MTRPDLGTSILVTRYLSGSWQCRRLFARLPPDQPRQRGRLYDAMASLLVDLHRNGVFWGDCSLANTLFSRDGQQLQAWLVDAETAETHDALSDGQREHDMTILVENAAAGLIDGAARLGRPPGLYPTLVDEALGIRDRYNELWVVLHAEPVFSFGDRYRVESVVRRLNGMGFVVDEVAMSPQRAGVSDRLQLHVGVGDRRFHADRLRRLTGLEVGDGQASILLGDVDAYRV